MTTKNAWARALLALLLCALATANAAPPATKRYTLPQHGTLEIAVPADWQDELRPAPDPKLPPTIAFHARQGAPFEILVTPMWPTGANVPAATRDSIRQSV